MSAAFCVYSCMFALCYSSLNQVGLLAQEPCMHSETIIITVMTCNTEHG